MTLRDAILDCDDIKKEKFHVDRWNMDVWLHETTAGAAIEWHDENKTKDISMILKMVITSVHDEEGNRVFTPDDADRLKNKSIEAVMSIFKRLIKINGLDQEEVEVMEANFTQTA